MPTPAADARFLLEVIATSVGDALAAQRGGADRIELCSALALSGLTPSTGLLDAVKANVSLPAMFMLRPREAGFAYADDELSVMRRDAELALEHGADGLVFGCLTDDGDVDVAACRRLIDVARQRRIARPFFTAPSTSCRIRLRRWSS